MISGDAESIELGVAEECGQRVRQAPQAIHFRTCGDDFFFEGASATDGVFHPFSLQRSARLLRCMSDEPPTIGMPSRSRTLRSMS